MFPDKVLLAKVRMPWLTMPPPEPLELLPATVQFVSDISAPMEFEQPPPSRGTVNGKTSPKTALFMICTSFKLKLPAFRMPAPSLSERTPPPDKVIPDML